jgi:hypothetical protein
MLVATEIRVDIAQTIKVEHVVAAHAHARSALDRARRCGEILMEGS